jgi:hypothetical protein
VKTDDLRAYEHRELNFISANAAKVLQRGHVQAAQDLYPEVSFPSNLAFGRGSVPLSLVLLLHDKLAVYVPPTSKALLEARWQMPMDTVFQLCERRLIQPLIGHPADYRSKHFEQILRLNPPSVWARGLGLLRELGIEDKLTEAGRELPLDRIAALSWICKRWRRHFPQASEAELNTRIKAEIATLYADLWLFGLGPLALHLKHLGNPSKIAQALLLTNEIKTYPTLFGLGGTAHYDLGTLVTEPTLFNSLKERKQGSVVVPPDLDILLKGVGVKMGALETEDIIEFHASGQGKHLRQLVSEFNRQSRLLALKGGSADAMLNSASQLQAQIKETAAVFSDPSFRRQARRTRQVMDWLFRASGVALGALVGNMWGANPIQLVSYAGFGAFFADHFLPPSWKEKATLASIKRQFSPAIAHVWKIATKDNKA